MGMLHVALRALLRRSLLLAIACTALLTLFISPRLGSVSSSGDSKDEPRTGHDPQTLPRPTRQSVPPRYAVLAEPSAEESLLESNSRNKGVHSLPAYLRSSQAVFETTVHETRYSLLESDSSSPFGNCIVTATPSSAPPTLHSCSGDQPIHAQTLVHPAMLLHPFPRRTLVLGFPEGSVAKELLRHFTLTSIAWVPWSSESQGSRRDFETIASRFSREYVKASGEHPDHDDLLDRVVIPETDSVKSYLSAQDTTTFDVIFIDADAVHLLPLARSKLRAGGIVAVPGGPASMSANGFKINVESPVETGVGETQYTAFSTLMREFKHVHSGTAFRPSRSELWTYHYATDSDTLPNPTTLHPQLVDIWIARRITGELSQYDGITHAHAFSIPAWLRAELKHATFVAISNGISQRPTPHSRKEDDDVEDEEFENLFGPTVLETPDGTGYEPYLHISSDELPAITPLGGSFFSYDFFGCDTMVLLNSTLLENTLRKGLEIAHAPSAKISVTRFPSLANVTEIDLDDLEDEENESARMSRAPAKHPAVILTATFDGGVVTVAAFPSFRYLSVDAMNVNSWVAIDEVVLYLGDEADAAKTTGSTRRRGTNIEGGRSFDGFGDDADEEDEKVDSFEEDRIEELMETRAADRARLLAAAPKHPTEKELKLLWRVLLDTSTHSSPASARFMHSAAYAFSGTYWTHPLISARKEGATAGTGQFATGLIKQGEPVFSGYIEESLRSGSIELVGLPAWKSEFLGHMSEMVEDDVYVAPMMYETDISFYTNHGCDPTVWYGRGKDDKAAAVNALHVQKAAGYMIEALAHYGPYDVMTARKDMHEGDEVTYDYATVDADGPESDFVCGCGSSMCRHNVTHKDWDTHPELVDRYGIEHFMPHISKLIRAKERRGASVVDDGARREVIRVDDQERREKADKSGFVGAAIRRRVIKAKGRKRRSKTA